MSSRELQRWNEEKPCEGALGSEMSRVGERRESGLGLQHPTVWESSFHCWRCRGLMYRIELRDLGGEVKDKMIVMPCNVLPAGTSSTR
jgi:hypothetical protein